MFEMWCARNMQSYFGLTSILLAELYFEPTSTGRWLSTQEKRKKIIQLLVSMPVLRQR